MRLARIVRARPLYLGPDDGDPRSDHLSRPLERESRTVREHLSRRPPGMLRRRQSGHTRDLAVHTHEAQVRAHERDAHRSMLKQGLKARAHLCLTHAGRRLFIPGHPAVVDIHGGHQATAARLVHEGYGHGSHPHPAVDPATRDEAGLTHPGLCLQRASPDQLGEPRPLIRVHRPEALPFAAGHQLFERQAS